MCQNIFLWQEETSNPTWTINMQKKQLTFNSQSSLTAMLLGFKSLSVRQHKKIQNQNKIEDLDERAVLISLTWLFKVN